MSPLESQPREIVTITDPGADDAAALAFLYALYPQSNTHHDWIGTYGNRSAANTTFALQKMERELGSMLRTTSQATLGVFQGDDRPRGAWNPFTSEEHPILPLIHGETGNDGEYETKLRGSAQVTEPSGNVYDRLMAPNTSPSTMFSLGATTEVAYGLQKLIENGHPPKSVVVMGGTINEQGNVGSHTEANLIHDPTATQDIFRMCKEKNISITLVPLDMSEVPELLFTDEVWGKLSEGLKNSPRILSWLGNYVGPESTYSKFYKSQTHQPMGQRKVVTYPGPAIHDLVAALVLDDQLRTVEHEPEYTPLFEYETRSMQFNADGSTGSADGRQYFPDAYPAIIPTKFIDPNRAIDRMIEVFSRYT